MPSIDIGFLLKLKDDYKKFPIFIETGTYEGNTILSMEPFFTKLYTIEYSEKYYNISKSKYNNNKIGFILGDSSIIFESLLPTIKDKCIFFLDGHWSSSDTGRSSKDCPLLEEITHINNLYKHEAIIIIDDYRLFGKNNTEDWSQITKENIIKIIGKRMSKLYHLESELDKDDRLIIHIRSI